MDIKYPVYFDGTSVPYHKKLTLIQAQRLNESRIDEQLRKAGFRSSVFIMDPEITERYGISANSVKEWK